MRIDKELVWNCITLFAAALVIVTVISFACPAKAGNWSGLTWNTRYYNPLAYPRSPEFSLTWENYEDIGVLKAVLGKDLGLVTYQEDYLYATLGLEFATWVTLRYRDDSMAFPLITEDFVVAVPLTFCYKQWSWAVKYNHISAHLGDGADELLDTKTIAYSREFVSLHLARTFRFEDVWTGTLFGRVYAHGGYLVVVMPKELGRWYAGGGFEIAIDKFVNPYIAFDGTWNDDVGSFDMSGQLGLWRGGHGVHLDIRVALTGYIGSDRRGQLVGRKLNNIGVGIFIR